MDDYMKAKFTVEGLRNIRQIGSIASSSGYLTRKIIKGIDFGKRLNVLELGAGDGVITKEILSRMSPDSQLYTYENHAGLAALLGDIRDTRLTIKGECVSKLSQLDDNYFDVVISSLPLALFETSFKNKIYENIQNKLHSTGTFIQYQYSLYDYKEIEKVFHNCKIDFCLFNLPPAFIYKVKMN